MANTSFENAIRSYLEDRAKADSLFAETYKKEGKSIKECCDYIISQARKQGGSTVVVDDNTVYGWDAWHEKFIQAKSGNCPYRDRCQRYARTIEKRNKQPVQLTLF